MIKEIITLTKEEIQTLTTIRDPLHFKNDFDLIYESHVPNVGIVFIEGEMKLLKKNKIIDLLPSGSIIGIHHLIHNTPLPIGVKIYKNSSVLMLEKSLILEALNQKSGPLYHIVSNFY